MYAFTQPMPSVRVEEAFPDGAADPGVRAAGSRQQTKVGHQGRKARRRFVRTTQLRLDLHGP